MTTLRRHASIIALALACPFAIAACVASHVPEEPSLDVEAAVSSITLGGDCAPNAGAGPADDEGGLFAPADCAPGADCGSFCTQSGVRITITAADEGPAVPFEVVSLRLYDMETGAMVESLVARNPRSFGDGSGYADWDQMVEAGADLHVTYDTTAPDWGRIGNGSYQSTYGMSFRVEVDVRVDGVLRTLEFSPASREAEIVT